MSKRSGQAWRLAADAPDLSLPGLDIRASDGRLTVTHTPADAVAPAYMRAHVDMRLGALEIRRVFRLYDDCPAIACDFHLRGQWPAATDAHTPAVIERIASPRPHLRLTCVQFFDASDRRNNMVRTYGYLPYRSDDKLTGNLFLVQDTLSDSGLFVLKEAPGAEAQRAWPGFDLLCQRGDLRLVGLGVSGNDLSAGEWTRAYGFVTGVAGGSDFALLSALRTYQTNLRLRQAARDEMIVLNTWGDRGQDTRIGEAFALRELEAAHRLGVSHFQLDDGWRLSARHA